MDLTKKDQKYDWTPTCVQAFQTLKTRFYEASILVHFLSARPTVIETDASDYARGAVLSQCRKIIVCVRLLSTPGSSSLLKAITTFTTKRCWQLLRHLRSGNTC